MEPPEQLAVAVSLASQVEASGEYIEDPKNMVARNDQGKVVRMKMKVTLSFKGSRDN